MRLLHGQFKRRMEILETTEPFRMITLEHFGQVRFMVWCLPPHVRRLCGMVTIVNAMCVPCFECNVKKVLTW